MKIVFMGTPEFARYQLAYLLDRGFNVVAAVTMPDKPMGRGMKLGHSAVKEYALSRHIPVLQPEKLKDPQFLEALANCNADIFVVVAFRMLPEVVWKMPARGTVNLHASLLPQYRGAAPINWAIMNGETVTGVTTFYIQQEIDCGNILLQREVEIDPGDDAGRLHDKLMREGAEVLAETLRGIEAGSLAGHPQSAEGMDKLAPRIYKEHCQVDWSRSAKQIHNQVRGLSPVPAAFTTLQLSSGTQLNLKLYRTEIVAENSPGKEVVESDNRSWLRIGCGENMVRVLELQLEGKKRMDIRSFLSGFDAATIIKVG